MEIRRALAEHQNALDAFQRELAQLRVAVADLGDRLTACETAVAGKASTARKSTGKTE